MADEPQDKPPAQPGAVPMFVSPQQVTAPLPLGQQPWAYPHFPQPAPVVEVKKEKSEAWDAAKLLGMVVLLGGVVFGAGRLAQKQDNTDSNLRDFREDQKTVNRGLADGVQKANSAALDAAAQAREINEQLKRLNITGSNHRRTYRNASDRPLPPSP